MIRAVEGRGWGRIKQEIRENGGKKAVAEENLDVRS